MSTGSYKQIDLTHSGEWQSCLDRLEITSRDVYFAPGYYQLYEEFGDGQAVCFVFEKDADIAIYPFLLNSINKLGYSLGEEYYDIQGAYGYNGVLSSSFAPNFIAEFDNAFAKYCANKNIVAEFTRFHPLLENKEFSKNRMTVLHDRETVLVDLTIDLGHIWENQYSSKNRNMIRKAVKIGYTIEIVSKPSEKQLECFIDIYHKNMKMVHAEQYFYFDQHYFVNTFKHLSEHAYLFNVKDLDGNTVCSSIFFKHGSYFHYHLSGRLESADNSVNNFLLSEAVKFAKESGAKFFHLGGGRTSSVDDSLLKFKKSFSKITSDFSIGKKIHNQKIYNLVEKQWMERNPAIKDNYKNFLLKYRV